MLLLNFYLTNYFFYFPNYFLVPFLIPLHCFLLLICGLNSSSNLTVPTDQFLLKKNHWAWIIYMFSLDFSLSNFHFSYYVLINILICFEHLRTYLDIWECGLGRWMGILHTVGRLVIEYRHRFKVENKELSIMLKAFQKLGWGLLHF